MIQVWRELSKGQTDTNHCARSGRIIQGMSSTITLQPEAASHPARAGDYCVVQFKLIACISMQLYLGVPLQCHRGKTCPRSHTPDDGREQLRHPWIKQRVILYTSGVGKSKPPVEKHFWRGSCALMRSLRFLQKTSPVTDQAAYPRQRRRSVQVARALMPGVPQGSPMDQLL